ncbi:MAG: type II toxin-antitoxin system PemK/MazF family toxin [Clostridia bacterium]|jgi:mRNA interferase MazF|nr:type II toxin-antitoxin system PemK/MazF family toxin [Clostridia bacterium]
MIEYQWGIFWADLEPVKGSEQAGTRPVLVISAEEVNQALPVVTILSLTSVKTGRKVYPIETLLDSEIAGLPKDSIAMAHQIRAISKKRLGEKCGAVKAENIKERVKAALKIYLEL